MIVVKVELWKAGDPGEVETLGVMRISNDGTGTKTIGHYDAELVNSNGRVWSTGRVAGHPRQAQSMWRLVMKCLASALPKPKPEKSRARQEALPL